MHSVAVKYQDLSEKQAASGLLSSLGIKNTYKSNSHI